MQDALGVDGKAGHSAVEQRDRAGLERFHVCRRLLPDGDLGIGQIVDQRGDRRGEIRVVATVDHQHRQRTWRAQVRPGHPDRRQRGRGRHPHPGPPAAGQLALQLGGVARIRVRQHGLGERVARGPAQRDPDVGQIGVHVEVSVARFVGATAGGRHTGAHQRDHQLARQRARCRLRGGHHLGHRYRAHRVAAGADAHRRGQSEPAVGRVVQCPQVLGRVHRPSSRFTGRVQQRETSPDDGIAHLADRHRARHRAGPPQAHQLVVAAEVIDGCATVHPGHAPPQGQGLGITQQRADPASHHQPLPNRAAVAAHFGGRFRRAHHRPVGQQMPRALALRRVRWIFLVNRKLVAHPPVRDELAVVPHQRFHAATAFGIHAQAVVLVGDLGPGYRFPARSRVGRDQLVGLPAQRRDIAGQPADGPPVGIDVRRGVCTVGSAHRHAGAQRPLQLNRDDVGAPPGQRVPHHDRLPRARHRAREQLQRVVPDGAADLPRVAPSGE